MTTEQTRDRLIEAEISRQEASRKAHDAQKQYEAMASTYATVTAEETKAKNEAKKARAQLRKEETQSALDTQAKTQRERLAALKAKFQRMAQGHLWYDGILKHQWRGVQFGAVAKRWILGDAPGLGKTRQAVGWLDLVQAKKVIIVCEGNIASQFAGEVMDLAPHRTVKVLSKQSPNRRREIMQQAYLSDEMVLVCNFEIWRRDRALLARMVGWMPDTVIVDEAHNMKNTASANYDYVRTLVLADNTCARCGGHIYGLRDDNRKPKPCPTCGWKTKEDPGYEYASQTDEILATKSVKHFLGTTGTPILNEPGDLFPLLHLCEPKLFKYKTTFYDTYCTLNPFNNKYDFADGALDNLKPLIKSRFLARGYKDAGVELPKNRVHVIPVELDRKKYPKQAKVIDQITKFAMIQLESGQTMTIMHLIAIMTRKRQANVWPGGIEIRETNKDSRDYGKVLFSVGSEVRESAKMDALIENVLEKRKGGHRQVVFSQFRTALAELEDRLQRKGISVVRFDGSTPEKRRQEIKNNFYAAKGEAPKWEVVLAHYKTGGTGLNLTGATVTHILDEEWNPGKRDQGYRRTYRMGQTEETEVFVYRIPGSIDSWLSNIIHRKEQIVNGFNGILSDDTDIDSRSLLQAMKDGEIL